MLTVIQLSLCVLFFVLGFTTSFDRMMKGKCKRNGKVLAYYGTSLVLMLGWVIFQMGV